MAQKNTCTYIVAGFLFLGALGFLVYSGFSEGSVYFLNVAEAQASTPEKLRAARLFGTVAEQGLHATGTGVEFYLEDKENPSITMPVRYQGTVPDTFKSGAEVIVEGGLHQDGSFAAKKLMTKCPSKYQKENRTEG